MKGLITMSNKELQRVRVMAVHTLEALLSIFQNQSPESSYAKKKVLVRQHIDGKWSVWDDDSKIYSYKSTPFREPVRSWKRCHNAGHTKGKHALQVYLLSKPDASLRGQNLFAITCVS